MLFTQQTRTQQTRPRTCPNFLYDNWSKYANMCISKKPSKPGNRCKLTNC